MSSFVSNQKPSSELFVLGAGGHTSVLVDMLRQQEQPITGIVSADLAQEDNELRSVLKGLPQYFSDDDILAFSADSVRLVNGIGAIPKRLTRIKLFNDFKAQGYRFASVISLHAIVSPFANLGEGVQVMPGAIIQAGADIGDNCIINTGSIVEHDCVIEAHSHLAPHATLCGQVHVGEGTFIGAGAVVIQNITIGSEAIIAAGARVHKHVQAGETVI